MLNIQSFRKKEAKETLSSLMIVYIVVIGSWYKMPVLKHLNKIIHKKVKFCK